MEQLLLKLLDAFDRYWIFGDNYKRKTAKS